MGFSRVLKDGTISHHLVQKAADGCPRSRQAVFADLVPMFLRQARAACDKFNVAADQELLYDLAHEVVIQFLAHDARLMKKWLGNRAAPFERFASAVAAWKLRALARNLSKRGNREVELLVDVIEFEEEPSPGNSVLQDTVRHCLDMLTEEERRMVALRYGEGMSSSDIAKQCGLTCNQVYQLTYRARSRLRELVTREINSGVISSDR